MDVLVRQAALGSIMRRLSPFGVLVGASIDFGLMMVIGLSLLFAGGLDASALALPPDEAKAAMLEIGRASGALLALGVVLGTGGTLVAGYVAGRTSGRAGPLNGAIASLLCTGITAYGIATGASALPAWLGVLLLPLGPVAGALGGSLADRSRYGL
jgi:hypothetical protein